MPKTHKESTLDVLFDSSLRVRLIKFFFYNQKSPAEPAAIASRLQLHLTKVRKELEKLISIGLIKKVNIGSAASFLINRNFALFHELSALVLKASPALKARMTERIKGLGSVKLALICGRFLNDENSQADLLVVGDRINERKSRNFFKDLEAEAGFELNYVVLSTEEFDYRRHMYDRFLRDLLDYKHEKLINKLGI